MAKRGKNRKNQSDRRSSNKKQKRKKNPSKTTGNDTISSTSNTCTVIKSPSSSPSLLTSIFGTTSTTPNRCFTHNENDEFGTVVVEKSSFPTTATSTLETTSLLSSIFGTAPKHDDDDDDNKKGNLDVTDSSTITCDLFSTGASQKWEQLSHDRRRQNELALGNPNGGSTSSHHTTSRGNGDDNKDDTKDVIQRRRDRNASKASIELAKSITVPVPSVIELGVESTVDGVDDNDDDNRGSGNGGIVDEEREDIRNGVIRLFVGQCDAIFRKNGMIILTSNIDADGDDNGDSDNHQNKNHHRQQHQSLFPTDTLLALSQKSKTIERQVCQRLDDEGIIWNITNTPQSPSSTTTNSKNLQLEKQNAVKYHEVASRCLGRLDIRHGASPTPITTSPSIISNQFLMPLIHSLLGGSDSTLVYAGLILSFPHSADQPWHQDGTALFGDDEFGGGGGGVDLPPYALNVFIPLEDVGEEVGPTEFWVGSHLGDRAREIMQQLSEGGGGQGSNGRLDEEVFGPCLKWGDALLYDYRICHRGTRNLSSSSSSDVVGDGGKGTTDGHDDIGVGGKTRPMLYLMYARPWFQEHLNFGSTRLFPPSSTTTNTS